MQVNTQILKAFKNNNFLSLTSNVAIAVFGFLSFILLVRSLKPGIFGEWVIYIAAGNFFEMLRFGITRIAIIRFLSGAKGEERMKLVGSNWYIGLIATVIIAIIIWTIYFIFPTSIDVSGYSLFFIWYPLRSFINLPFNNAISILMADQRFDRILLIRLFETFPFMLFLLVNLFFLHYGIMIILYVHLFINLITSLICLINKWDGIQYIFKADKQSNSTILNFGKYSTGTSIGANLLKSSDTMLLALSPFIGTVGVAFYSVPLRLTEILEIPLRSFVSTAFPRMSKASLENKTEEVKQIFYSYSGGMTFVLLPILIVGFIFAKQFVLILGGPEYVETQNIFRIFCIYGLFISVDKFTGITLDSINKPQKNFLKVVYMAVSNIFGDILAIFYASKIFMFFSIVLLILTSNFNIYNIYTFNFQFSVIRTLEMVAFVTILFTFVGIGVGLNYLNKEINLEFRLIFTEGWKFFKKIILDILAVFSKQKSL